MIYFLHENAEANYELILVRVIHITKNMWVLFNVHIFLIFCCLVLILVLVENCCFFLIEIVVLLSNFRDYTWYILLYSIYNIIYYLVIPFLISVAISGMICSERIIR